MRGALVTVCSMIGIVNAFAQVGSKPEVAQSPSALPAPKPVERSIAVVPERNAGRSFLKNLTIESFGFTSRLVGPNFESPGQLTNGPFTTHGLECARCMIRPNMDRTRYTIPAFGAQATLLLVDGRVQLFSGFGGINAWKPDNTVIEPQRRGRSYNDQWLVQGVLGANVAVDKERHLWLGPTLRYLENFGEGKKHYNSVGAAATFKFGR